MKNNNETMGNIIPSLPTPGSDSFSCSKCGDSGMTEKTVDGRTYTEKCDCFLLWELEMFLKTSGCPQNQYFSAMENVRRIECGSLDNKLKMLKGNLDSLMAPQVEKEFCPHNGSKGKVKLLYGSVGHLKTTISLMFAIWRIKRNFKKKKYIRPLYVDWQDLVIDMKQYRRSEFGNNRDAHEVIKKYYGDTVIVDDLLVDELPLESHHITPIRKIIDNSNIIIFTTNYVPGDSVMEKMPELSLWGKLHYEKVIDHFRGAVWVEMIGKSYRSEND